MLKTKEADGQLRLHIPALDGLRGLAILFVATGHLFSRFYIFNFGWTGLNLFYILSGYLITGRLFVHIRSKPFSYFRNFYGRRVLRIFPLYFGCLIFFFLILPWLYGKYWVHFGSLYHIQLWYWLYISNWRIILYGLPPNPLFFHFWSLAVEEQFYLLWPVIFLMVTDFNKRLLVIAIFIFISLLTRYWTFETNVSYYNSFTTAEPLLLGCIIRLIGQEGRLDRWLKYFTGTAAISVVCLAIILFHNPDPLTTNHDLLFIGYSNIDLIWTFLLCSVLTQSMLSRRLNQIFKCNTLVWLGKYSYGIYVFHWLILQLFINKYELWYIQKGYSLLFSYWLIRIIAIIAILVISYLSYQLYEKKFLALKRYLNE